MALSNVSVSYVNYLQGRLAEAFDYGFALWVDAGLMLLPLLVIPFLQTREEHLRTLQPAID